MTVHSRSTDHYSLLKHRNSDLALFRGGGGDTYLKSDFYEGRVTKILNFALKIKGGGREGGTCEVLRPCHPPKKNSKRALGGRKGKGRGKIDKVEVEHGR